ncbi:transmembrane protein 255B isoform X1 [Festucalex cinctus]
MTARVQGVMVKPLTKSCVTGMMLRVRQALWLTLAMLCLSVLLMLLGVYTTTRTQSLNVTGHISGVILTLGSFLGLLGLCLEENRKQLLTTAIVFLSFGIITSFLCLVIDGACVAFNMDVRPLKAGRCQYYRSGSSYVYGNVYTTVSCWNLKESCNTTVQSGTCFCCDLYDCANGDYLNNYYEFVGVSSCDEVITVYVFIWILTGMNFVALFMGILTTAVLGSIKDLCTVDAYEEESLGNIQHHTRNKSSPYFMRSTKLATEQPTAPLLMDANENTTHHIYPGSCMVFSSDEAKTRPSSSSPPANPPPFAPSSWQPFSVKGVLA